MDETLKKHYGFGAISRSLRHFFVGKGFKVVSSLAFVLLLARYLSRPEYAAYISFKGMILIVGALASVGIQPVMFRYIPELRSEGNNRMMYRMLAVGILLRLAIVSLMMFVAYWFLPGLASIFNFEEWLWIAPWFMLVGVIDLTAYTISQSLESLLWQKEAQYSLATGSMIKLVGLLFVVVSDRLDLVSLVIVEGVGDAVMIALLLFRAWRRYAQDPARSEGSFAWWGKNRRRALRYGMWGFLVNQTHTLYGSGPNRLLTAHFMPTAELAVLGAADSLLRLARRSMPTRLLSGMIRPVFMARFSATGEFDGLGRMTNLVYRLNMLIFCLPIALLFVVGEPFFDWLTDGKYGAAGPLLGGFLILMVTEGMRVLLGLLLQAVEKNHVFLFGNLVQSVSILCAIPLFPKLGLWALVVANTAGTIAANVIAIRCLKYYGYVFRLDWALVLLIAAYAGAAALVGWAVMHYTGSVFAAAAAMIAVYGGLLAVKIPLRGTERSQMSKLFRKAFRGEAASAA